MPDQEYSYQISVHDFDKSLLPANARTPGTDQFVKAVTEVLQREYAEFGGWVQIVVGKETVQVTWRSDPKRPRPVEIVNRKLAKGETKDAIRLLEHLRNHEPNNTSVLYNLGMVLSDAGHLDQAQRVLRQVLSLDPQHVNARVALGVVLMRQGKMTEAVEELRQAVVAAPSNPWAQRNLGAAFCQIGKFTEAEPHLRKAVELNPDDQQSTLGLAKCLLGLEQTDEADALFAQVIKSNPDTSLAGIARQERTKLAHVKFRSKMPDDVRPDVVMYLLEGIQKFGTMSHEEVQQIGFEIAVLGRNGFDTDDPEPKYKLKHMPGQFSGLHLVSLMYAAFKIVRPGDNIGFDMAKEYEQALKLHREGW